MDRYTEPSAAYNAAWYCLDCDKAIELQAALGSALVTARPRITPAEHPYPKKVGLALGAVVGIALDEIEGRALYKARIKPKIF